MLQEVINWIVQTVGSLGYIGIFVMMFLESSFFPFPSEVVMIPAGYLASQGEMNLYLAVSIGILGSLTGALFNYFLAVKFGRGFLLKYGNYLFLKEDSLEKLEKFFQNHGHISTFTGRLIPGIRQYISLPAGLAKMDKLLFSIYTTLGAGIWVIVLALLGYFLGNNQYLIKEYLHQITIAVVAIIAVVLGIYFWVKREK